MIIIVPSDVKIHTFLVPSDEGRISLNDSALNSAFSINIFLKYLFKPTNLTALENPLD